MSQKFLTESAYAKIFWPGVVLWSKTIYLHKIRNISRTSGPFADSNVASHNAGITPETLRKKHAGPVSVRFKYTIQITNYIPSLPSRSVDAPLRMKPTFSASARAPHL